MAAKSIRIALNPRGVRALLQSPEITEDLERRGEAIATAAGGAPDFEVRADRNRDRTVVFVTAATFDGRNAESEDRALTRAIDAGR
jgi:hypothetical protein